jgi:hypothetical protein
MNQVWTRSIEAILKIRAPASIIQLLPIWSNQNLSSLMFHEFLAVDELTDDILDSLDPKVIFQVDHIAFQPSPQDFKLLCPLFAWDPADTIKRTLAVTIQ